MSPRNACRKHFSPYLPFVLFGALVVNLIVPPSHSPWPVWILVGVGGGELFRWIYRGVRPRQDIPHQVMGDLASVVYLFLFFWHLSTAHTRWLDPLFFPPPEKVIRLFYREFPGMLKGAVGSLATLFSGFGLALFFGILFGLVIGWKKRLYHAAVPLAKSIGPVPPVIYIPYAVCFLPNLRSAQVLVIFVGAFWPIFLSTLNGVQNISRGQLDVARTLNLKGFNLLSKVILPGALPSISTGAVLGLVFSFIMLTAAELLGATSGVGWYVKNHADFGDFPRVIVGILFISLLVLITTSVTDRIERRLLQWRD